MNKTLLALALALSTLPTVASAQPPVHHSVVAGTFFPGSRDSLLGAIEACMREARRPPQLHSPPIGIIAPHAGYAYSGIVAASAFRAAERGLYKTVIVLGPSHFIAFDGVATTPAGSWETPVGSIAIDVDRAQSIMKKCAFVRDSAALFAKEHSLETQLPFLQRMLPKCKLVPLEFGSMTGEQYVALANAIADLVEDAPGDVLVVASSDLSHYHGDAKARYTDNITLNDVLDGDLGRLVSDLNTRSAEMCGFSPVITMMLIAERMGARPMLLSYATTANATGDTTRVVGYGALSFTVPSDPVPLNPDDRRTLLAIARRAIVAAAAHAPSPDVTNDRPALDAKSGLFVTLTKNGQLRGCIGATRATQPLWKAATEMGNSAACKDPRFTPVTPDEVRDLHVEISVLTPMRRVRAADSIIVGKHGLYIMRGNASGLLLPQVAVENHWDRAELLTQVCIKAGLPGDAWRDPDARLYAFTAEVFSE